MLFSIRLKLIEVKYFIKMYREKGLIYKCRGKIVLLIMLASPRCLGIDVDRKYFYSGDQGIKRVKIYVLYVLLV